jgi:hypothetical protein
MYMRWLILESLCKSLTGAWVTKCRQHRKGKWDWREVHQVWANDKTLSRVSDWTRCLEWEFDVLITYI